MGFALVFAEATDTPVWFVFGATVGLAVVTGVLAFAAFKALGQLRLAVEEIEEVKKDRHVEVWAHLGERWQSQEMVEAFQLEQSYTPESLARLFTKRRETPFWRALQKRRRTEDAKARTVLLRVPNYFEDALFILKVGGLNRKDFDEYMSGVALEEWQRWAPAIKEMQTVDDLAYIEFETWALQVVADEAQRAARLSGASEASESS